MRRRSFVVGLGVLTASGTAALGTGAFSAVEAERDVDIEVVDDTEAYLSPVPTENPRGDRYASIDSQTGRMTLEIDELNPDAVTSINEVFEVANEGTEDVGIWFEKSGDNTSAIEFFDQQENRLDDGEQNAVDLETGNEVVVDIVVDTDGLGNGDQVIDTLHLNASSDAWGGNQ